MIRLVTLDLDGTLIPGDTAFGVVLRAAGHGKMVDETDAAYFAGTLALEECFWQQWELVRKLSLQECHRALRNGKWMPGIAEGVARLREAGLRVCLLTDQPSTLAEFLGRWGLNDPICSPVTVKDGNIVSIDARFEKLANLERRLGEWNLLPNEVCHVGNGPNDIPVFKAVALSVAVGGDARVEAAATIRIPRPPDLGEIVDAILARAGKTREAKPA